MFLRSLSLKGFKSFAEPTTLEMEPGVTVVVGPNGSGKSNVVDAIAWVLGAQAPSAVRSQKMDDVIFAGTATRPALGRAEVTLTIDNSAGLLPIELSEVTIRRTLFRNGDSEYAINGVACRLLDVQELLSDAGVGRQQHTIVSQGQIDAVLNARAEERRAIIEEAAGVLKYRKRKEKAERRLDATEANLLRLQDLLREVRRQLRPLERQADAARRHGELTAELRGLRIFVAGRDLVALRTRLASLAGGRAQAAADEVTLKHELAGLDAAIITLGAELTARGTGDLGDRLARADQLREKARGLLALIAERSRGLERDRGQLLGEGLVATLEADAARLREELAAVAGEIEGAAPEVTALEADEAAFAVDRERAGQELDPAAATAAARALAEVHGELRTRRSAAERVADEVRRSEERRADLGARIADLERRRDQHRADCESAERLEGPLVGDLGRAEERLGEARRAHEAALARRQGATDETLAAAARVEALQMALDVARARAGAEQLAGQDGVVGTLLELVRIDEGWEAAVEAALGEALTAVVVADRAAATRALRALREADTAGAVLALGAAPSRAPGPAGGRPVRPHVTAERADVGRLLDVLLATATRVDDIDDAIAAAVGDPAAVVVTATGDRFGSTGWRVGAAAAGGVTVAALEEAERRHDDARVAASEAAAAAEDLAARVAAAAAAEADLAARLDANDARFSAAAEGLAHVQNGWREAQVALEPLERRLAELAPALDVERRRIAELESLVPALEADETVEADAARDRQAARAGLDAAAAVLVGRRQAVEVRLAGWRERAELLRGRLAENERRLADDVEARVTAERRRTEVERSLTALGGLARLVEERHAEVEGYHRLLAEQRRRQSDEIKALADRLDDHRGRRATAERRLDETRERSRRAEVDEAEARLRLEAAVELLRHDLDVEPAAAEAASPPPLPDGVSPPARVRELERELRLLGPINPLALEEFTELAQRHSFLEEQLDDVRTTRRELSRVIKAIDQEIQTVFASAYADVADHFAVLFGGLFPGGTGRLVLTTPDDLLNTGVEVEARPGGKNVKKLSLLSGGERSLTALAFLFAVFRSRPSPFYVMDEVEAALDDVNLHRFLGLIAEFRAEAQLLIVSHQKRTMEAGDCLFGVTMQPGGSSKVIAERVAVG